MKRELFCQISTGENTESETEQKVRSIIYIILYNIYFSLVSHMKSYPVAENQTNGNNLINLTENTFSPLYCIVLFHLILYNNIQKINIKEIFVH